MPIRDRTKRRLPRLGVIRLGYLERRRRGDGSEYSFPRQADYFILRDAPKIEAYFAERGITKPRELDVILPFPTLAENYDAHYQVWTSGVLVCQGDGERVLYASPMRVTQDAKGVHVYNAPGATLVANGVAQCAFSWGDEEFAPGQIIECPGNVGPERGWPHCAACRMSGILKVTPYADELFEFGYYQITTGSWRNHMTIMGTLGSLPPVVFEKKLPFTLRMVQEQTVYQDDKGKRHATERWFLHLMPHPDLLKALFARQANELGSGVPRAVPSLAASVEYEAEPPAPPPYAELGDLAEREIVEEEEREDDELVEAEQAEEEPLPEETHPPPQGDEGATTPEPAPKQPAPEKPAPEKPARVTGRPYGPETLQRRIMTVAAAKRHRGAPTEKMIGLLRVLAGQLLQDPEHELEMLVGYLVGHSVGECSAKEVASLIDWLKDPGSEPGHALVDRRAVSEAQHVLKLVLKTQGQQSLPGMEG